MNAAMKERRSMDAAYRERADSRLAALEEGQQRIEGKVDELRAILQGGRYTAAFIKWTVAVSASFAAILTAVNWSPHK
jgi:hypothetical protein